MPNETKKEQNYHFFASSLSTWRTGDDVKLLMKDMDREIMNYNLFYVPLPGAAHYEISMWAPQVEGSIFLGTYNKKGLVPDVK